MGVRNWGVVLGAIAVLGLSAGTARAAEFSISFDEAVINTGGVTAAQTPGVNRHNDAAVEPFDVVRLTGSVSDEGAVTIPAHGVTFKREVRTIRTGSSYYAIDWRAPGGFTGTFDASTGELEIRGDLEQTVTQLSNRCVSGPIPVTLSTESGTSTTSGERFTEGLGGDGALVGSWISPLVKTTGPDCEPEVLHCLARADLADTRGNISLATETNLVAGLPSRSPCVRNVHLDEVVYSHGGRITLLRPRDSERRELTNEGRFLRHPDNGDDYPALSPDGSLVAFVRGASPDYPDGRSVELIDLRGEEIFTVAESGGFRDPSFDGDGSHIFYVRTGDDEAVIRSELNGRGAVDVAAGIPRHPDLSFTDADLSPDGGTLLVGMEGHADRNGHPIARTYAVDLATGAARLLQKDASHGAWSPDGEKILFESKRDKFGFGCWQGRCNASSRLYVMNADGSGADRVFGGKGIRDETSPDWSPDGSRITFTSDRNGQKQLYISRPDGKCLGFLTNGNVPSHTASWGTMFQSETAPLPCGDKKMKPRIELPDVPGEKVHGLPRLWLGPVFRGDALAYPGDFNGRNELSYSACVRFSYRDCWYGDFGVFVDTSDVCGAYPVEYESYDQHVFQGAIRHRGAVVEFRGFEGDRRAVGADLLSGGRVVSVYFSVTSP